MDKDINDKIIDTMKTGLDTAYDVGETIYNNPTVKTLITIRNIIYMILVWSFLIFFFGYLCIYHGIEHIKYVNYSKEIKTTWDTETGIIYHAEQRLTHDTDNNSYYEYQYSYQYTYQGKEEKRVINKWFSELFNNEDNLTVTVYINPKNPSDVYTEYELNTNAFNGYLFCIIGVLGLGIFIIFRRRIGISLI